MSKRYRNAETRDDKPQGRSSGGSSFLSSGPVGLATLVGVALLVFMNVKTWSEGQRFQKALEQMDARIVQLGTKVDNVAKAAAPARPQQGPDPNKVYTVKTAGSPAKGPETAPITIAEFSEFQ